MKSLRKILSLKVCLLAVCVFSGVFAFSFSSVAFAADSATMYGKTTPVLTSGINNAGTIWFQNDGATVYLPAAVAQQPHLTPDPAVPGGYIMEGWAWSDNLGWVSFYCVGGTNNGAACGAFDYRVKIDAAGVFHGYAWNDAMGYISVNSENHVPPALDGGGKPIVYGLKMSGAGAISGYAWSQSLGWLNFNGVYASIKIEVPVAVNTPEGCPSANDAGLCGCFGSGNPSGDPSELDPTLDAGVVGAVKVADGYDKYVLSLYFKDENGAAITADKFGAGKQYEAKVLLNWKDTVRRNQTDASIATVYDGALISKPFQSSAGAVIYKPVLLYTTDINTLDPVSGDETPALGSKEVLSKTTFDISSVAPTSKANVSKILDKNGVATGTVSNDDLSLVPGFSDEQIAAFKDSNSLQLESIDWAIKNKTTGVTINGISYFDEDHGKLEFKPALEVSKMTGGLDPNTLWMFRNVPVEVEVEGENNKTGGAVVDPTKVSTKTEFVVSQEAQGAFSTVFTKATTDYVTYTNVASGNTGAVPTSSNISTWFSTFLTFTESFSLEASLADTTAEKPGNYSEGAGLYSKINYESTVPGVLTPKSTTYFSNHLPRVTSTAITNPAVVIQGTTYAQGNEVFSPQEGINITGIGDQNVNVVRDLVYENIQKLLIDKTVPSPKQGPITITSLNPSCTTAGGCLKIDLTNERIFYFNTTNLILNSGGGDILPADKNTVLIVAGGDIHIESNLYTSDSEKKKKKLGLVALRESDLGEGNIYIGPEVTNIQALIIADGTMFSAPNYGAGGFSTTKYGEPQENIDPLTFNKQLVFEGGISSRNCIGCVDNAKTLYNIPTRGPLSTTYETNKEIAKKYDLNYLRYFSLQLEYDPVTGAPVEQGGSETIDPTKSVDEGGDLVVDETLKAEGVKDSQTNAVYIKYVPPSADSFVFSKNKSLTF